MSFDYSMYEWRKYKQYYTEKEDGSIEFAAGTPSHVRESYARYVHQQQSMKDFATRRDLDRKKGTFDFGIGRKKKEKGNPSSLVSFQEAVNQNESLEKNWFDLNVIHVDERGNAHVGMEHFDGFLIRYEEAIVQGRKAALIGLKNEDPLVSIVTLNPAGKIIQIQDFVSKA